MAELKEYEQVVVGGAEAEVERELEAVREKAVAEATRSSGKVVIAGDVLHYRL